jgi:hypothetical protein
MRPDQSNSRELAALVYALGVTRGALQGVLVGDAETEEVQRIVQATSLANIARVLGVSEAVLAENTEALLSTLEKEMIQGVRS